MLLTLAKPKENKGPGDKSTRTCLPGRGDRHNRGRESNPGASVELQEIDVKECIQRAV